jgi:hypothetical protein
MRGYAEESEEVKAARDLREAARKFTGAELVYGIGRGADLEESRLLAAAVTYAESLKPKRRKKGPKR